MTAQQPTGAARWTPKELARGVDRYRRYLALFGLDEHSLTRQVVCDIGCGPLGGVLAVLRGITQGYQVDLNAAEYRPLHRSRRPLLTISMRTRRSPIPARMCDAVFCLGPTVILAEWRLLEWEARRICKIGGRLYLWWRVSDHPPLVRFRKPRGVSTDLWRKMDGLAIGRMRQVFRVRYWVWGTVQSGIDLPNLYPGVKAYWAVLTRLEGP